MYYSIYNNGRKHDVKPTMLEKYFKRIQIAYCEEIGREMYPIQFLYSQKIV